MATKGDVKAERSAALAVVSDKLDEARGELRVLKNQVNRLQNENVDLAQAAAEAKAALDAAEKAASAQVALLRSQMGDESGRASSLAAELAAVRSNLAEERSASSSAIASKTQDVALIAGLRAEVGELQSKLYRIRDAVKAI